MSKAEAAQQSNHITEPKENSHINNQNQNRTAISNSKEHQERVYKMNFEAIDHELQGGSLVALKQMSNTLSSHVPHCTSSFLFIQSSGSVIKPINDINDDDAMHYSKSEQLIRCKLASLYRLVDILKCSQGIYNHITVGTAKHIYLH